MFSVVSKPVGPICNLNCKYCFYLDKERLYPSTSDWKMSDDLLNAFIRQYIEAQDMSAIHFAWQGGEPTVLGLEYFRKIVELQRKYANGKQIRNALQTNGTLLDDAWCDFLAQELFLVGLSIDGPRELHDRYRIDKGGNPTFDRVMRGLELLKKHRVEFNTLTAVHRANSAYPLEVYHFLKQVGSRVMQFIPIVERETKLTSAPAAPLRSGKPYRRRSVEPQVSAFSVQPLQFGRFLCSIFDEWVRHDVGDYFVQTFDVALESWLGLEQSLCIFGNTCGAALAIEHNGDLYSCDHFVRPENRLGNILQQPMPALVCSPAQQEFGRHKRSCLPECCRACDVLFACNGECPRNRFMQAPEGEIGLNYLCPGYKLFFRHIDAYMRFMAAQLHAGRPATSVMHWLTAAKDYPPTQNPPGRNDHCTCGSGKKFKKCCGKFASRSHGGNT